MIFINIFFTEIAKKGLLPAGADVASGPDGELTRGARTTVRMRRGAEATWQGSGWPTRGAGGTQGADTWQEATHVHVSTRTPVGGYVADKGRQVKGPRVSGPW